MKDCVSDATYFILYDIQETLVGEEPVDQGKMAEVCRLIHDTEIVKLQCKCVRYRHVIQPPGVSFGITDPCVSFIRHQLFIIHTITVLSAKLL